VIKVAKLAALICGVLLTLLFIALLIMVTRPALLTGVSGDYLSNSFNGSVYGPACHKIEGGDWRCVSESGDASRLEVDWMGCWKSFPVANTPDSEESGPDHGSGCIQLGDILTFN